MTRICRSRVSSQVPARDLLFRPSASKASAVKVASGVYRRGGGLSSLHARCCLRPVCNPHPAAAAACGSSNRLRSSTGQRAVVSPSIIHRRGVLGCCGGRCSSSASSRWTALRAECASRSEACRDGRRDGAGQRCAALTPYASASGERGRESQQLAQKAAAPPRSGELLRLSTKVPA